VPNIAKESAKAAVNDRAERKKKILLIADAGDLLLTMPILDKDISLLKHLSEIKVQMTDVPHTVTMPFS
jgi:hypothetical protein